MPSLADKVSVEDYGVRRSGGEMRGLRNGGVASGPRPKAAWAGYAACAWALAFAAVHLYWALGGTVGLPEGLTVAMNPALFVIDVLAVPLSVVGALLALSLVRPWGQLFPRRLLLACGWGACALLIVHSAPTLIGGVLAAAGLSTGDLSVLERWSLFVYEPWFFIGGLLYGAAAWHHTRGSRASGDTGETPGR